MKYWVSILLWLAWVISAQATSYPDVASVPDISQITDWSTLTSIPVLTGQVSFNYYYPPTTVANLANYKPTAGTFTATEVTDATVCTTGALTGGGTKPCRVLWNGASWIGVSGTGGGTPGLTADHIGTTVLPCNGVAAGASCTPAVNVTCTGAANSAQVTVTGHVLTAADQGKIIAIGSSYGINGSTSQVGAGGNTFADQPLIAQISSVAGTTAFLATVFGGSSAAALVNGVTNAKCDIGTDNATAMQTALNTGNLTIPDGSYLVNPATFISVPSNRTISCVNAGKCEIFSPRNDAYVNVQPGGIHSSVFMMGNVSPVTNITFNGLVFTQTDVIGTCYNMTGGCQSMNNFPIFAWKSNHITVQNSYFLGITAQASFEWTGDNSGGTDFVTYTNNYHSVCSTYGPGDIVGGHSSVTGNYSRRGCGEDVEPNNTTEAAFDIANTFTGNTWEAISVNERMDSSYGASASCESVLTCRNGQSVTGETWKGARLVIFPPYSAGCSCGTVGTGYSLSGNAKVTTGAGSPTGECGCPF